MRFAVLIREWAREHFPHCIVGQQEIYSIVGLFIPNNKGYMGAQWVASLRYTGPKITVWFTRDGTINPGSIIYKHFNLCDRNFFEDLKNFIVDAKPSTFDAQSWPEVKD